MEYIVIITVRIGKLKITHLMEMMILFMVGILTDISIGSNLEIIHLKTILARIFIYSIVELEVMLTSSFTIHTHQ